MEHRTTHVTPRPAARFLDGDGDQTMDSEEFTALVGSLLSVRDGKSRGFDEAERFAGNLANSFRVVDCEGEVVPMSRAINCQDFVNNSEVMNLVTDAYAKHEERLLEELRRVFEEVICKEWPGERRVTPN